MQTWRQRVFAWDGFLPWLVAGLSALLPILFPKIDGIEIATVIFIPMGAAILRAMIGAGQIRRACDGGLPVLRQLGLAVAIILLMFFEGTIALLVNARGVPGAVWGVALLLYVGYLTCITLSLSPRVDERAVAEDRFVIGPRA